MIDLKDIFNSWITSFNPTKEELAHATDRYEICSTCEFKEEILKNKEWSLVCGSCGCPIKKKIYSTKIRPCPEKKWDDVDKLHGKYIEEKSKKTLF